jgi:hypothetical protein
VSYAAVVGILTALGAALSYVSGALPHGFAADLTYAGVALTAADRFVLALENIFTKKVK